MEKVLDRATLEEWRLALERLAQAAADRQTLHREARRQGERAIAIRDADERRTQSSKGIAELAASAITPQKPFRLVIELGIYRHDLSPGSAW